MLNPDYARRDGAIQTKDCLTEQDWITTTNSIHLQKDKQLKNKK